MASLTSTSGGGGDTSCSEEEGRRGLVKDFSKETWKVGEIR